MDVASELDIAARIELLRWPEAHDVPILAETRAKLRAAAHQSKALSQALSSVVTDYLEGLTEKDISSLQEKDRRQLLNYVVEEVSAFIYLTLNVTPLEVYAGDDLPVMRRIASGEFRNVLPFDLSQRTHIALKIIGLPKGLLRDGTPDDWPEVERLLRSWPTHFVQEAIPLAEQDFIKHRTLVCEAENGGLLGFMVWSTDGKELELLWSAVEPTEAGKGIGSAIVRAVLAERRQERRAFGRTATVDSQIPGTTFDGGAYVATHRFFERLGFRLTTRHDGYWGPTNHMVIIEMRYDC
jgi:ribosomal protein S18 acetylase RimI-like enzyme